MTLNCTASAVCVLMPCAFWGHVGGFVNDGIHHGSLISRVLRNMKRGNEQQEINDRKGGSLFFLLYSFPVSFPLFRPEKFLIELSEGCLFVETLQETLVEELINDVHEEGDGEGLECRRVHGNPE